MKYVSLDVETTGLDPENDQVLQISMVVEDTKNVNLNLYDLPHWTAYVRHDRYTASNAFAVSLNGWIFDILSGRKKCLNGYPIVSSANIAFDLPNLNIIPPGEFLYKHFGDEKVTVAGKNAAGFDLPFIKHYEFAHYFDHRVLDPGSLFVDFDKDERLPGLNKCLERAGVNTKVTHDAREDALDVIRVLRSKYT